MAIQGRGYYGIGTGKKDFGFSTNVTLPLSGGYNIPSADLMPHESRSGKGSGQASFAASKDDKVDGRSAKKSKSWKNRLSGFFKRDKRRERDLAGGESLPPDKGKIRPKKRSSQSEEKAGDDVPEPADDVNAKILMQEGLTQESDEHDSEENVAQRELDKDSPLDNEGSDLVVAQEVEVVYFDEETVDENELQVSAEEDHEHVQEDELEVGHEPILDLDTEHADKESTNKVESYGITSPEEHEQVKSKKEKSDQEQEGTVSSKQKKKKSKVAENRKSTALEVTQQDQDKNMRKKNGKTKKTRPKSMPAASIAWGEEQETAKDDSAEAVKRKSKAEQSIVDATKQATPSDGQKKSTSKRSKDISATKEAGADDGVQEATTLTEGDHPEAKKTKEKKTKKKNEAAAVKGSEMKAGKESLVNEKKSTKTKQKTLESKLPGDDSTTISGSPPPPEEVQLPKQQVTVGVIKENKKKTRPFLDDSRSSRSKVYQSEQDHQEGEDNVDAEEKELLHDMETLQLMTEGAERAKGKKVKKRRQGIVHETLDASELAVAADSEVATVIKEEKQSKASKKTKSRKQIEEKVEPEIQPQLEPATVPELDKKQGKKTKKTKTKEKNEPEPIAAAQSPSLSEPIAEPEKKRKSKTAKNTKAKGKREAEIETEVQPPPQPEVMGKADKKQSKVVKKTKSKGKSEPTPEPEAELTESSVKKEVSKKKKSKEKVVEKKEVVEEAATPKEVTVGDSQGDEKAKKKKKKLSKSSHGTPVDSPALRQQPDSANSSNRSSRAQLATKTSKSKIASEASDDLVWIGADKLSHKKSNARPMSKDDTAVDEEDLEAMNLSSSSRSTSHHELSKEERKTFREELRKASSQHSVDTSDAEGSVRVEIDPNVKVTKSGVVKGGKGSRRPSLQYGFGGSGIEQTDSASPNEGEIDSEQNSKKISMDLSAVPQTSPTLGLTHGHDKRDLVNRSTAKRRPMSMYRENSREEEVEGDTGSPPQNHVLAAHINKLQKTADSAKNGRTRDSASLLYEAAAAKSKQNGSGHGASVARQLFPSANGEPQSGEGSASSTLERSRRNKTVDKPVKTLGIASESKGGSSHSASLPSWVALAKNKQKRSSLLLADKKEETKSISPLQPTPSQQSTTTTTSTASASSSGGGARGKQATDTTIPKMGTVQARLAAFERK